MITRVLIIIFTVAVACLITWGLYQCAIALPVKFGGSPADKHSSYDAVSTFSVDGKNFYDTKKVWKLMKNKPVKTLPITLFVESLNEPHWDNGLTASAVLANPQKYPDHMARINAADLTYPVLIVKKDKHIIADGMHRLMAAVKNGHKTIRVQIIPRGILDSAFLFRE